MAEIYFTSDTHFGHSRVREFEPSRAHFATVEGMNEALIDNWNATVRQRDTVWHLGDFAFGRVNVAIAGRLNGIKRLVLGNHDLFPITDYQPYFGKIYGACDFKGFLLTHIPAHPDSVRPRFRGNLHGHLHSSAYDIPYFNVSVERHGLAPVAFEEIVTLFEKESQ